MKSTAYYIGVVCGGGVAALIAFLALRAGKKRGDPKPEFDEMQLAARGRAFKTGFFSLLIANLAGILVATFEIAWLPTFVIFSTTSLLGIAVFAVSAIRNDAYFGFNENRGAAMRIIGLMGLLNLGIGIMDLVNGELLENGQLHHSVINLLVSVLSAVIYLSAVVHNRKAALDEGEE